jgi:hypothetical protein
LTSITSLRAPSPNIVTLGLDILAQLESTMQRITHGEPNNSLLNTHTFGKALRKIQRRINTKIDSYIYLYANTTLLQLTWIAL